MEVAVTDGRLAERIARNDYGDYWFDLGEYAQAKRIEFWRGAIEKIRAAGLEVVEAEEGR